jgi:SSS family solute:Na+ symporter
VIVIPGMVAAALVPALAALKDGQPSDVTYNNALPLLMKEVLPNGVLGVAIAGLLASFMAGMAANLSAFNTIFTYDLWQDWLRPGRPDGYYLRVARTVTVVGSVLAIGTASLASTSDNLMDYVQALFSFFNAPLFATFLLGLFWKRMTGPAGWTGLIAGTATAVLVDALSRTDVLSLAGQGASFVGASAAFVVDIAVSVAVSLATRPRPEEELRGLVWSLTPRNERIEKTVTADRGWYRSPALLGGGVLAITAVLYGLFW